MKGRFDVHMHVQIFTCKPVSRLSSESVKIFSKLLVFT